MSRSIEWAAVFFVLSCFRAAAALADGERDNDARNVRPVPPAGVELPEETRKELGDGLGELRTALDGLAARDDPRVAQLLPDVEVFHKAVHDALVHGEFFEPRDADKARWALREGLERAEQLSRGEAAWPEETGLVVRAYRSRIDDSVQPYGLVVPPSYQPASPHRFRLDLWFHGRGERLSELNFLWERSRNAGRFQPRDTFVLHPYGRYCNAFKFAGEIDVLEALQAAQREYPIDEDRVGCRGFSMGGAAAWQFAVHYTDRWFAANPGAGFAETPEFLKFFQKETLAPTWYERRLWHWYDCTDWAANLYHCPTVAYSGELDVQKQAADIMAEALAREGIELTHIIGPGTRHTYHPDSSRIVEGLLDQIAARGRERVPRKVVLRTYTLRYNRMYWVTVDGLDEHWRAATVEAEVDGGVRLALENVSALTLAMPAGWCPFEVTRPVEVRIEDQVLEAPRPLSDRSWRCSLVRDGKTWRVGEASSTELRKRHGLQGPIDDAFLDAFLFVRPTRPCRNEAMESWTRKELSHALTEWRRQFRGEAPVKPDTEVTDEDIASRNLVLWGDPAANTLLERIAPRLPIRWSSEAIAVGRESYDASHHALLLVYPNPLNPSRYVVLNSGFTFREYDYLNNARQVAKLPDWAVIDLRTPPDTRRPGKVVGADFFSESWAVKAR